MSLSIKGDFGLYLHHSRVDIIKALNRHVEEEEAKKEEVQWFVCITCNKLVEGEPLYLKHGGSIRPFCKDCCFECKYCNKHVPNYKMYKHEHIEGGYQCAICGERSEKRFTPIRKLNHSSST